MLGCENCFKSAPLAIQINYDVNRWIRLWFQEVPTSIRELAETQQIVNISGTPLSDEQVDLLCAVLYHEQCCQRLTLSEVDLTQEGLRLCCSLITQLEPEAEFRALSLAGNKRLDASCVPHLIELLKSKPDIEELNLSDTEIGLTGARDFIQFLLKAEKKAKETQTSLLQHTTNKLVRSVKMEVKREASDLETELGTNRISDTESLSEGPEPETPQLSAFGPPQLKTLSLKGLGLDDGALLEVAEYLRYIPALHTLDLSEQNATPAGWRVFLETVSSLRASCRLMHLVLDDNPALDDSCLLSLILCIRHCSSLQTLSIEGATLQTESREALQRVEQESGGVLVLLSRE